MQNQECIVMYISGCAGVVQSPCGRYCHFSQTRLDAIALVDISIIDLITTRTVGTPQS